jgi:hypothetical protein
LTASSPEICPTPSNTLNFRDPDNLLGIQIILCDHGDSGQPDI